MKLVLDTNVFVAAGFNPRSSSAAILEAITAGQLTFVWNAQTRAETQKILRKIPPLSWDRFDDLFTAEREYTGDTHPDHYPQITDRDDRKFAALAAAAGAVLISNDDHLLSVRQQLDVRVLTPAEFTARHLPH